MSEMISIAAFKIQLPFEAPFQAFAAWRRARQTAKVLRELSTSQLEDIGVLRAEIDKVANRRR